MEGSVLGKAYAQCDVGPAGIFANGKRSTEESLGEHCWEACYHVVGCAQGMCTTGTERNAWRNIRSHLKVNRTLAKVRDRFY